MMKKRILWLVAGLAALGGISVLVLVLSGEALFFWLLRPGFDFDPAAVPPAPNYAEASAWAALPERVDFADFVPEGETEPDRQGTAPADVFFIHPTTYFDTKAWNSPLEDARTLEMTGVTIAGMASAFNHCCRVYAPKYRQAAIGAYMGHDDNSLAAFRIAYADVSAALAIFLEHHNQGRPFVLASHSQGTMHALRLLEEIARSPARERLVAAYTVGYRPGLKMLAERIPEFPRCTGATDTGCIIGWDTHSEDGDASFEQPIYHWHGERIVASEGVPRLCTNPISWQTTAAAATRDQHLGAVSIRTAEPFPDTLALLFADGPLGIEITGLMAPRPKQLSARCENGRVLIPALPEPYEPMDASGSYHLFDYDLFYLDIRHNAVERVEAFLTANPEFGEQTPDSTNP